MQNSSVHESYSADFDGSPPLPTEKSHLESLEEYSQDSFATNPQALHVEDYRTMHFPILTTNDSSRMPSSSEPPTEPSVANNALQAPESMQSYLGAFSPQESHGTFAEENVDINSPTFNPSLELHQLSIVVHHHIDHHPAVQVEQEAEGSVLYDEEEFDSSSIIQLSSPVFDPRAAMMQAQHDMIATEGIHATNTLPDSEVLLSTALPVSMADIQETEKPLIDGREVSIINADGGYEEDFEGGGSVTLTAASITERRQSQQQEKDEDEDEEEAELVIVAPSSAASPTQKQKQQQKKEEEADEQEGDGVVSADVSVLYTDDFAPAASTTIAATAEDINTDHDAELLVVIATPSSVAEAAKTEREIEVEVTEVQAPVAEAITNNKQEKEEEEQTAALPPPMMTVAIAPQEQQLKQQEEEEEESVQVPSSTGMIERPRSPQRAAATHAVDHILRSSIQFSSSPSSTSTTAAAAAAVVVDEEKKKPIADDDSSQHHGNKSSSPSPSVVAPQAVVTVEEPKAVINVQEKEQVDKTPTQPAQPAQQQAVAINKEEADEEEEDQQEQQPQPVAAVIKPPPKKISLAALRARQEARLQQLERQQQQQPKVSNKVASLRQATVSSRPYTATNSNSYSSKKAAKTRPSTTSGTKADKTKKTENNEEGENTFLTAVFLPPVTGPGPRREKQQQPVSGEKTETNNKPQKTRVLRVQSSLRYSVTESSVVLTEFCPHRKSFLTCESFFCHEAYTVYCHMESIQHKAKSAGDLILTGDKLWRSQLQLHIENKIENATEKHEFELKKIQKKLNQPTTQLTHLLETKRFLDSKINETATEEELFLLTGGLTSAHHSFVNHHIALRNAEKLKHKQLILDHYAFVHAKNIATIRSSVQTPLRYLDNLRDGHIEAIQFHANKVSRIVLYLLQLTVTPCLNGCVPKESDVLHRRRVEKVSLQAQQLYRQGLQVYQLICRELRLVYSRADEEIDMLLTEGKMTLTPNSFQAAPAVLLTRDKLQKMKKTRKMKTKMKERRHSLHEEEQEHQQHGGKVRPHTTDGGGGSGSHHHQRYHHAHDYDEDYDEEEDEEDEQHLNDDNDEEIIEDDTQPRRQHHNNNNNNNNNNNKHSAAAQAAAAAAAVEAGDSRPKTAPTRLQRDDSYDSTHSKQQQFFAGETGDEGEYDEDDFAVIPSPINNANNNGNNAAFMKEGSSVSIHTSSFHSQSLYNQSSSQEEEEVIKTVSSQQSQEEYSAVNDEDAANTGEDKQQPQRQRGSTIIRPQPLQINTTTAYNAEQQQQAAAAAAASGSRSTRNNAVNYQELQLIRSPHKAAERQLLNTLLTPSHAAARSSYNMSTAGMKTPQSVRRIQSMDNANNAGDGGDNMLLEAWHPQRCYECRQRFRGHGKKLPSLAGEPDDHVRGRALDTVQRLDSLITDFGKKVTLGFEEVPQRHEELRGRLLRRSIVVAASPQHHAAAAAVAVTAPSPLAASGSERIFCSWSCVKKWSRENLPPHKKYHNDHLIDMAAGYAVQV